MIHSKLPQRKKPSKTVGNLCKRLGNNLRVKMSLLRNYLESLLSITKKLSIPSSTRILMLGKYSKRK